MNDNKYRFVRGYKERFSFCTKEELLWLAELIEIELKERV